MKQKFIIEVSFSAMNEMSLYERLRNAVFEWQTTEPKVKSVSVVPAQKKAESLPTGLQHGQQSICNMCVSKLLQRIDEWRGIA
jgi:hypothetical protein